MNKSCCIVLVVYKSLEKYDENEKRAFFNLLQVFFNRDFYIVCPRPLVEEFSKYATCIPLEVSSLSYGEYNNLCKSVGFYQTFLNLGYAYQAIVQLDVWVFQDNLDYFLNIFDRDQLDYIGAPWYGVEFCKDGTVGNGGFCIRRLEKFRDICAKGVKPGNEDTAILLNKENRLNIAPEKLALEFSFEEKPLHAFRLNNYRLPMGTHAYASKSDRLGFWKHFIFDIKEIKCKAGNPDIYKP